MNDISLIIDALKAANDFGKEVNQREKEVKKEEKKELTDLKKLKINPSDIKRYRNLGTFFYAELCKLSKNALEKIRKNKIKLIIAEFKDSYNDFKNKVEAKLNSIKSVSLAEKGKSLFWGFLKKLAIYGPIIYFFRRELLAILKHTANFLKIFWAEIKKIFIVTKEFILAIMTNLKEKVAEVKSSLLGLFEAIKNKAKNFYDSLVSNILQAFFNTFKESAISYVKETFSIFSSEDDEFEKRQKAEDKIVEDISKSIETDNVEAVNNMLDYLSENGREDSWGRTYALEMLERRGC